METVQQRKDLLTGENFIPRRKTQMFSKPENRIKYHNQKATDLRDKLGALDKPLKKNYAVVIEIMQGFDEKVFHPEFLSGKGYNFKIHNNVKKVDGKLHAAVYEFVVITQSQTEIKIVRT